MAHGKFYVYIQRLKSNNDKECYYVGYTSRSVSQRTKEHRRNIKNHRTDKYTGRFKSCRWVYYETYDSREEALAREKEIKAKHHDYKEGLIRGFKEAYKKYKLAYKDDLLKGKFTKVTDDLGEFKRIKLGKFKHILENETRRN